MEASGPDSSPQSSGSGSKKAADDSSTGQEWVPGPNLEPPGWLRRRLSILRHALKFSGIQMAIMFIALALLILLVLLWDVLRPPVYSHNSASLANEIIQGIVRVVSSPMFFHSAAGPSSISAPNWVEWWIRIQSLLGIGTLFVALFVWYGEIHEDWEKRLPRRMSVFFLHKGLPVIVCRYIWLAGEDDLRAWGQQVAAQAARERFLNFYPNVKAQNPGLAMWIDGKICRHYDVCFELTDENSFLARYPGMCRYQNLATGTNTVSSVPLDDLQSGITASVFPFNWPEREIGQT